MKKVLLSLFFLCLSFFSIAQTDLAAEYASAITTADLQKYLTVIASAEMEGRETGTQGQRKAADYIQSQFMHMNLQQPPSLNGYQQFYPLYQDTMAKVTVTVNGNKALYGQDIISPLSANENLELLNKKLIFIGYGINDSVYSDYEKTDVKNKIVVFFSGEPKKDDRYLITGTAFMSDWSYNLSRKLNAAKQKGALAAFVINTFQENFTQKEIDQTRKAKLSFHPAGINNSIDHCILSHAFAKKIFGDSFEALFATAKDQQLFQHRSALLKNAGASYVYEKNRNIVKASNVLGVIEGTDKKDEFVFITGHYDHLGKREDKIYYGADDDGSGTCAVLEMANAFARAASEGHRPRRTIVFMTVSGEEKGLWGSEYYSDHALFPLDRTSADLNIDMVGRIDTERKTADTLNYVYVIGHDKLSSDLPVINEGVNKRYTGLTLDYKFDDPNDAEKIYYRSDHYNFARKGIPVLFFYDGMLLGDYHKPTDTIDKINWDVYVKRVKMIFHTAWEIANRDQMLKRDIPLP